MSEAFSDGPAEDAPLQPTSARSNGGITKIVALSACPEIWNWCLITHEIRQPTRVRPGVAFILTTFFSAAADDRSPGRHHRAD